VNTDQSLTGDGNSFDLAASAQMEAIVTDLARMYRERNEALEEVARAHHDALLRLALAADYKDDDTGVHIVRIGFMSEALALLLGKGDNYAALLRQASPMHDIGKIGIPDNVLKKPGPLTPEERQVMNGHPKIGAEILGRSRIPLFRLAAEVALTHHERFDGGYPAGMSGAQIPLSGASWPWLIHFDALTMDRVYRQRFLTKALTMLLEQRGLAFDPDVVDTFLRNSAALIRLRNKINLARPTYESLEGTPAFDVRRLMADDADDTPTAPTPLPLLEPLT
jgi:putative two-component system response regulator